MKNQPLKPISSVKSSRISSMRKGFFACLFFALASSTIFLFSNGLGVQPVYAGSTLTPTSAPTNTPIATNTSQPTATLISSTNTPTVPSPADTEVPTNTPVPPAPTSTPRPNTSGGGQNTPPTAVPTATYVPVQEIPELGVGDNINFLLISALGVMVLLMWAGSLVTKATKNA